jgi:hypothetical protein
VGKVRAEPAVFGPAASDPTVSRLIGTPASGGQRVLAALRTAPAEVREPVRRLAGNAAPDAGGQVVVDIDGVLVLAHSGKQDAAAPWKKTFGHHPPMGFVDHGRGGSGEPVVGLPRPGNAGSNTAAGHIEATGLALARLLERLRRGRRTLIRTDAGGGTRECVAWLAQRGRWLSYSVGMTITDAIHQAVLKVPASVWTPAVEPDGDIRDGAWVTELAGDCLKGRPTGPRLIVREEPPRPGAQLRFTDADGIRRTCRNRPFEGAEGVRQQADGPSCKIKASLPRTGSEGSTCRAWQRVDTIPLVRELSVDNGESVIGGVLAKRWSICGAGPHQWITYSTAR